MTDDPRPPDTKGREVSETRPEMTRWEGPTAVFDKLLMARGLCRLIAEQAFDGATFTITLESPLLREIRKVAQD